MSDKKNKQLGEPYGTANHKLKRNLIYSLAVRLNLNTCFRCRQQITSSEVLSIDHKVDWLDSENPRETFFDLENIAFSHLNCNIAAGRRSKITGPEDPKLKHGTDNAYDKFGCRCNECKLARSVKNKKRIRK